MIVVEHWWTRSTEAQTGKGDDINEFDCALKPKVYTKIVQAFMKSIIIKLLAVRLEDNYFHQFQVRSPPGLGLSVL